MAFRLRELLKGMVRNWCNDCDEAALIRRITLQHIPSHKAYGAAERYMLLFEFNQPQTLDHNEKISSMRYFLSNSPLVRDRAFPNIYKFRESESVFDEWILTDRRPSWWRTRESVIIYREGDMFTKVIDNALSFIEAICNQWFTNKKLKDDLNRELIRVQIEVEERKADVLRAEVRAMDLKAKADTEGRQPENNNPA